ncbi:hypothetical protein RE645_024505, partial [Escherichia coli]|nr:hypothetical protein [Escherichia coli]
ALTFQNHTDCPLTDFGGKTSIFSHPVYLFLRKFSLQDSRGGSTLIVQKIKETSMKKSTFNLNFVASWAVVLSVFVGAGGAQCICARSNVSS